MFLKKLLLIIAIMISLPLFGGEKGTVYIIAATDCSFNPYGGLNYYDNRLWQAKLYAESPSSIFTVMDTAYRANNKDSFGTPFKLTWYMMGGNVFDLSTNCNVPIRSNNALYLMQKYHSENIKLNDDVISIHYHNYLWFDSDGDGISYWNQGMDFNLSEYDYEQTLCKYLVENDVFPVSFRSGWHYMDNAWQAYEERYVPFDYSNAAPFKQGDEKEPSWFVDWSESPLEFKPYHPNADNYQIEGDLKQWRIRSVQFQDQSLTLQYLTTVFQEAANGHDQMICVWGHPAEESSFLNGLAAMYSNLATLSSQYDVNFRYCRDNEAMRLWMGSVDTIAPELTVDEIVEGRNSRFRITSNEPIFQRESPFIVIKTIYEKYERLDCNISGPNEWETVKPVTSSLLAKLSVAVCDSVGNQTTKHLDFVTDDIFIDEKDPEYSEISGSWSTYNYGQLWNLGSRRLSGLGSMELTPNVETTGMYKTYVHAPTSDTYSVKGIFTNSTHNDTFMVGDAFGTNKWTYLGVFEFEEGNGNTLKLQNLSSDKILGFDVIRFSPLVPGKKLVMTDHDFDLGYVSIEDTSYHSFEISNEGYEELNISISTNAPKTYIISENSFSIPAGETKDIIFGLYSEQIGIYVDSLIVTSDDPLEPRRSISIYAEFYPYLKVVDNDDESGYVEVGGDWHTSSANGYGPSTRYAWYHANGQYAEFTTTLAYADTFDVQFIIPETENAVDHAHHILIVDGSPIDTVIVDQNHNSGQWRSMGEYVLPADVPITVRIQDNGGNTNNISNVVLRADAVRFIKDFHLITSLENVGIPIEFKVYQNYPNPFNPSTQIYFALAEAGEVKIDFFDLTGRKIDKQIKAYFQAGYHRINWNPKELTSGIYLFRVQSKYGSEIKKCTYLK